MKDCDSPRKPTTRRPAGRFAGDPLHAMRVLKRWVRVVVYGAVCAEWPLYYLVLGYPLHNIASSWAFGMVVATVAIEFAFAQGYKLRKQGIYPAILALEVGANRDFKQACEAAVRLVADLLRADQVVLAFSVHHDGELTTMATHGISPEDVPLATPLPWCQRPVKQAMKERRLSWPQPARAVPGCPAPPSVARSSMSRSSRLTGSWACLSWSARGEPQT